MHEATIAQSILSIASSKLKKTPNADTVMKIQIIVGEFRNVDIESLEFAFDHLKDFHDGCSGCKLEAETIQAKAVCRSGTHTYRPSADNTFKCEICDAGIGKLLSGEELDVIGITLLSRQKEQPEHARTGR